eukprot:CAMPEP_0174244532 /NCGR_PEP_ID=MMETSP0417-20130205/35543_1 /TAXON_ID=242541 /ORGANISM="Mayorella sp, Strain BSH-02190019" /LENGTH=530 /DNA_ID=CAMNT_0015324223 /DNA_START=207 /DNA_END=1795 /DNA_ORIENTATION=-
MASLPTTTTTATSSSLRTISTSTSAREDTPASGISHQECLSEDQLKTLSKDELIQMVLRSQLLQPHVHESTVQTGTAKAAKTPEAIASVSAPTETSTKKEVKKKGKKVKPLRRFDMSRYGIRHIALKVTYLGWNYHGLAAQQDVETIETHLFEALTRTRLIEDIRTAHYSRCGRTDRGVSAFGQVVSLHVRSKLKNGYGMVRPAPDFHQEGTDDEDDELIYQEPCASYEEDQGELCYTQMLNRCLPSDIRVVGWAPVPVHFSARFSCTHRTYKYFFLRGTKDLEKMQVGADQLVGFHDYRNFCKMDAVNVKNFERRILSFHIRPLDQSTAIFPLSSEDPKYQMCEMEISGYAFLWHQVRCMAAILFLIGEGKEDPSIVSDLLDVQSNPRKPIFAMASDVPLVLYDTGFEELHWRSSIEDHERLVASFFEEHVNSHLLRAAVTSSFYDGFRNMYFPKKQVADRLVECDKEEQFTEDYVQFKDLLKTTESTSPHHSLMSRKLEPSLTERVHGLNDRKRKIHDKKWSLPQSSV